MNQTDPQDVGITEQAAYEQFKALSLHFQKNEGQVDDEVSYFARSAGQTIFFTPTEIVYSQEVGERDDGTVIGGVIRQTFLSSSVPYQFTPEEKSPAKVNYFIGNEPDQWQSGLDTYKRLRIQRLYENISARFYGTNELFRQEFVLERGELPSKIRVKLDGVNKLVLLPSKDMGIETEWGNFRLPKPRAIQDLNGEEVVLAANYQLLDDQTYTFTVSTYDDSELLIIQQ